MSCFGASSKIFSCLLLAISCGALTASAQVAQPVQATSVDRPLPDIPRLMHAVEDHQRAAEALEKDYIYHSIETSQELDGHGAVKKTGVNEYDVFWIDGVPVSKQLKKDGKDLTAEELKKEDQRLDKQAAKARERREKEDAKGKETDPRGNDEVTVSRLLELGSFTNPRRLQINGRDTIAVDYIGDPKAKTSSSFENVIRDMAGTVWIDEQDTSVTRIEGRFLDNFKIGGGLVVNIQKGTNFAVQFLRINDEVWLPARIEGHGSARAFLFFKFNGNLTVDDSHYRKFKTTSTIRMPETKAPEPPK